MLRNIGIWIDTEKRLENLHFPSKNGSSFGFRSHGEEVYFIIEFGWMGLRPGWLGLRPGWLAQRGGRTDRRTYVRRENLPIL